MYAAISLPGGREIISTSATAAIEGSASPRKPSVMTRSRSASSSQLARRVTLERRFQLGRIDAAAVVRDTNGIEAARHYFDSYARGAGIKRVLKQLFDDGGGTLYHLARGDAGGDFRRQNADRQAALPFGLAQDSS